MTKIVSLAQLKGGSGKTTVSVSLAVGLAAKASVVLIDADSPQHTAAAWHELRDSDDVSLVTAADHVELGEHIDAFTGEADYLILDMPPRIAQMTEVALLVSDLTIAPVSTSGAELWALSDFLELVEKVRETRPDVDVRLFWNQFRANTKAAKDLPKVVAKELALPQLKTRFGYRAAYYESLGRGMTADQWDTKAKAEVRGLVSEVRRILKG